MSRLVNADLAPIYLNGEGCEMIKRMPTVDAVPVVHGHWIFHTFDEVMNGDWLVLNDWQGNGFECSNCGRLIAENEMAYKYRYCPNCGAKMDGGDEDGAV